MTDHPCPNTADGAHDWRDWERVVFGPLAERPRSQTPTGERARECKTCGRWEVQWAQTETEQQEDQ